MRTITKGDDIVTALSDIVEVETRLGGSLPTEYRQFLLKENGGAPLFPLFKVRSHVHVIHGFMRIAKGSIDDLLFVRNALSDTLDVEKFIPIARTMFGDMVCLRLSDGAVFFWRHDQEPSRDGFDKLDFLADSFSAFANTLYAEESREARDSLHKLGKIGGPAEFAKALAHGANLVTEDGHSLGEIAAMHGNVELFKAWLASRMPVGRALHIAAKNGRFPIIDHMTSLGFNINSLDEHGKTPLDVASWDNDYKQELRGRGAKTSVELGGR